MQPTNTQTPSTQRSFTQPPQPAGPKWYRRRWVQFLLIGHLALLLLLAYPGYQFYRSWIQPDRPQPAWNGPLTAEQRRTIFDALGHEVDRLWSYHAEKGIDWDATQRAFWTRAAEAPDDAAFYRVLQEMLASLHDGHTGLSYYPGAASGAGPGVRLLYTEGQYAVAAVLEAERGSGVKPGDVLLSVDDRPPAEAEEAIRQRIGGSTEAQVQAILESALLQGRAGTEARVRFRRPDGSTYETSLPRRYGSFGDEFAARPIDGFGYIRIPRWGGTIDRQFDEALESLRETEALIIDVRGNGGGNDALAEKVIGRLVEKPALWARIRLRFGPFWTPWTRRTVEPSGPWAYTKPVVVLIDGHVFSSNDFFVGGLVRSGRAVAIGSPTGGGSGNPAQVTLPGGARVRISRWQEAFADGTLVEGNGTEPQVHVVPTIADLAAGRDPVLERAVEYLRTGR